MKEELSKSPVNIQKVLRAHKSIVQQYETELKFRDDTITFARGQVDSLQQLVGSVRLP